MVDTVIPTSSLVVSPGPVTWLGLRPGLGLDDYRQNLYCGRHRSSGIRILNVGVGAQILCRFGLKSPK